ncbi:MAG: hypothetical protein ACRESR_00075 [Gammaproteobacteria bacterium]
MNLESGLIGVSSGESSMEALLEQAADGNPAEEAAAACDAHGPPRRATTISARWILTP